MKVETDLQQIFPLAGGWRSGGHFKFDFEEGRDEHILFVNQEAATEDVQLFFNTLSTRGSAQISRRTGIYHWTLPTTVDKYQCLVWLTRLLTKELIAERM